MSLGYCQPFYIMELVSHLAVLEIPLACMDIFTWCGEAHISYSNIIYAEIL